MRFNKLIVLLITLSLLQACETEIDLFGDGPDVTVVFALLDQSAPVQYFRINPTFKGEGDARELAGDPSLTNYSETDLDVRLYDMDSIMDGTPIYYRAEGTTEKELNGDGLFDPNIYMYKLLTPVSISSRGYVSNAILRPNHNYKLWIKNKITGIISSSQILLGDINDLKMISPPDRDRKSISTHLKFYTGEQYTKYTFQFGQINGARRYKLEMKYYYTEGLDTIPDSATQVITYLIGEVNDVNEFSSSISIDFPGERFYSVMNNVLDPNQERTGRLVDFIVTAGGNDLDTYIEVQDASISGLSQERPSYTNIDNGLGVFSFRSTKVFKGFFLNLPTGKWMVTSGNPYTYDRFKCIYYGTPANSLGVTACR